MDKEFESFLKEKRFVDNVSNHTVDFYQHAFRAFKKAGAEWTKTGLTLAVATMRERGMTPECADARIRGINPFLTWLHENGYIEEHLKVKRQKLQKRVIKTFTEPQVKAILSYKPKGWYEKRLYTLMLLLLDCGVRINEALTLTREGVDFDNLLITVIGKGNKERILPFSVEYRKTLYKWLQTHKHDLVFPTQGGGKLNYNDARRDFRRVTEKLGIEGFDGCFHAFRRCFATNYIRQDGNPLKLQRMLGHTTLKMTNDYVKLVTDDLTKEHNRTSLLRQLSR